MRRPIVLLALACVFALAAAPGTAADFSLTAGLDFGGTFENGTSIDSAEGYSIGGEIMFDLPWVELGAGLEYGFDRGADTDDSVIGNEEVDYKNVYLFGRVDIIGPFFLTARLGYGDLGGIEDIEGGGSWSAGAGISLFDRIKVEALLNNFSGDIDGLEYDYETYSARLIITF
jgi:hypothetical protein